MNGPKSASPPSPPPVYLSAGGSVYRSAGGPADEAHCRGLALSRQGSQRGTPAAVARIKRVPLGRKKTVGASVATGEGSLVGPEEAKDRVSHRAGGAWRIESVLSKSSDRGPQGLSQDRTLNCFPAGSQAVPHTQHTHAFAYIVSHPHLNWHSIYQTGDPEEGVLGPALTRSFVFPRQTRGKRSLRQLQRRPRPMAQDGVTLPRAGP